MPPRPPKDIGPARRPALRRVRIQRHCGAQKHARPFERSDTPGVDFALRTMMDLDLDIETGESSGSSSMDSMDVNVSDEEMERVNEFFTLDEVAA